MTLLRALPLVVVVALAACGDKKKSFQDMSLCERYADLELRCGGHGEGAREIARSTCEKAQTAEDPDLMLQMIKLESVCATPDTDCATYKACVDKQLDDNDPVVE